MSESRDGVQEVTEWVLGRVWEPERKAWRKASREEKEQGMSPGNHASCWYYSEGWQEIPPQLLPPLENQYFVHLSPRDCVALLPPEYVRDCGPGLQGLSCAGDHVPDLKDLQGLRYLRLDYPGEAERALAQVSSLTLLRQLILRTTGIQEVPSSWSALDQLEVLEIPNVPGLAVLLQSLQRLKKLKVMDEESQKTLPTTLGRLSSLQDLDLHNCSSLEVLPKGLSSLSSLQTLDLSNCSSLKALPKGLGSLSMLRVLNLDYCSSLVTLPSLGGLVSLERFTLPFCTSLEDVSRSLDSLARRDDDDYYGY